MAKTIPFNISITIDGKEHVIQARTNVKQLRDAAAEAAGESGKLAATFLKYNQGVEAMRNLSGALQTISGTLNQLTAESRSFSAAMASANTMAGKSGAEFAELKGQVAALAETLPVARDQLANGLYQVISNGVPEDNWIDYLNASARSAVGGIADVGEVVKVTSTIIKNYGMEWSAAQDIQDKIQLTAKNGVTSFEQLAAALPSVTGQAAQLGVSLEEMLGVMSTLTGVTGNTSEVSTQLSSVLTALTKESTKAQKMAAAMGIEFNAASIKAAGGFQNFIKQLDEAVTAYSQKSGMLKESIYSQLFGRAEALRLVNALNGELADKFQQNIDALTDSAGTIDDAFETMASTGSSKLQMLQNKFGEVTDTITKYVAPVLPVLNFSSQLGMSVVAVLSLTSAFSKLNIASALTATKSAAAAAGLKLMGLEARNGAIYLRGTATAATTAQMAIRGLMVATGVGAAIAALTMALQYLLDALAPIGDESEEASQSLQSLNTAEEEFKRVASETKVELDNQVKALKAAMEAHKGEKEKVEELNKAYGDAFGTYKTASEWYDTLTKKSKSYAMQLAYEAKARSLATSLATKQIELDSVQSKKKKMEDAGTDRQYVAGQTITSPTTGAIVAQTSGSYHKTREYQSLEKQEASLEKAMTDLQEALEEVETNAQKYAGEVGAPVDPVQTPTPDPDPEKKKKKKADPVWTDDADTLATIGDNIKILQAKLQTAHKDEAASINKEIKLWQDKADAISKAGKDDGPTYKADATTLSDIEDNVEYFTKQLDNANAQEAFTINQQIELWQDKADAIRNAGKTIETKAKPVFDQYANTLSGITDNIAVLKEQLNDATLADAAGINKQIAKWEKMADAIRKAGTESDKTSRKLSSNWGIIKGLGSSVKNLTDALDDNKSVWETITSVIDSVIGIYEGISGIVGIVKSLTSASEASAVAEGAKATATTLAGTAAVATAAEEEASLATSVGVIAANKAETTSYMELAAAEYMAAHAYIPFAGVALGTSFTEAANAIVLAQQAIPFAEGGIISGPTYALMGEYAGASNNPEVVAPLDKLRSMLQPSTGIADGSVVWRVKGRDLVAVLHNQTNTSKKSTGIKI